MRKKLSKADRRLGDIPFDQVVAERGYPIKSG